jgi:hypothetical protein
MIASIARLTQARPAKAGAEAKKRTNKFDFNYKLTRFLFCFFFIFIFIFSECKVLDSGRSSQYSAENSMSKKGDALSLNLVFAPKLRPLWLG